MKKIKVLSISDHPLSPSGVGTQTRYVLESILRTEMFEVVSLAGAIKHEDYETTHTEEFGDKWAIIPVDGYGSQDMVRGLIKQFKPDILWFMTDPRFWGWLWQMDNEIRPSIPLVYYHVWDNYPYPTFNKVWYDSTDVIATISKVTSDIVQTVSPKTKEQYIPHAVPTDLFMKNNLIN